MSDTIEIEIPNSSWTLKEIKELGDCITGITPKTSERKFYSPEEFDFIAPADLGDNKYVYSSEKRISKSGLQVCRILPKNAVMCVCIGSSIGKVGLTYHEASASNQQINAVVCNDNYFPDFIYYLLLNYKRYWKSFSTFGPVPILSKGKFEQIKFPVLKNKPEQHKIIYVLSTIQKSIEQQNKLIRSITELKKALMQKLFTEGVKGENQKQTEIGRVPESWEIQPFENIGEVVYGIQAAVANNLKPIGHKILTNKNIMLDGKFDLEKLNYFKLTSKRHFDTILRRGDLLFNWRSGSKEHVGKTALFNLEDGEYVHSSFILRIRVDEKHNNTFLYYYLNYLREIGYYQKVQTFSVNAKFNKSAINAMLIALPKKKEQDNIAEAISALDRKLDNWINNLKLKQTLFKILLNELMTGQRRVNELEFEGMAKEYKMYDEPLSMVAEE